MSKSNTVVWFSFWPLVVLALCLAVFGGCAASPAHPATQSWDQANLKRNDYGCPSAVFIAPGGELQQCDQATDQPTITFTLTKPKEYATIEEAALAAFAAVALEANAEYYEWGGSIVKTADDKFMALPATTDYQGDHVSIRGGDFALNGVEVANYHTHPCLPDHYVEFFSPPDLIDPIFFRHITFMGDFCSGKVHEFKPGDKPDAESPGHDNGAGLFLTKGRIIGQFTTPHKVAE